MWEGYSAEPPVGVLFLLLRARQVLPLGFREREEVVATSDDRAARNPQPGVVAHRTSVARTTDRVHMDC